MSDEAKNNESPLGAVFGFLGTVVAVGFGLLLLCLLLAVVAGAVLLSQYIFSHANPADPRHFSETDGKRVWSYTSPAWEAAVLVAVSTAPVAGVTAVVWEALKLDFRLFFAIWLAATLAGITYNQWVLERTRREQGIS